MLKTLVLYESRYGCTREAARIISPILGPSKRCIPGGFIDSYRDFDFIILGTPIYNGRVEASIEDFIEEEAEWLAKKDVAFFCTCLHGQDGLEALRALEEKLGNGAIELGVLGGRLNLERLKESDFEELKEFTSRVGIPTQGMDLFRQEEVIDWALHIKDLRDKIIKSPPPSELKEIAEEFLKSHNTCTLATGTQDRVRATPVEYHYHEGHLYIISEGGEKFANILLNDKVSVAIYEEYTDMENLAGMQITGEAIMIDSLHEYDRILELVGLNPINIKKIPMDLNIIKIRISKLEYVNSKFQDEGYSVRQIIKF